MTYKELYGLDIKEYCQYIGTTPEQLIKMIEKKIELLRKSYLHYANKEKLTEEELMKAYHIGLFKSEKERHLKRIKEELEQCNS